MDEDIEIEYQNIKLKLENKIQNIFKYEEFLIYDKKRCNIMELYASMHFSFFEEFYYIDKDYRREYEPFQKFNYYILVEVSHYKIFKKNDPTIWWCIFPDMTKFIKKSKNKKIFNYKSKKYYKIKLRSLNNTFETNFNINIHGNINYDVKYFFENYIEVMCQPVKKPYTNLIRMEQTDNYYDFENIIDDKIYSKSFKISDYTTLYMYPQLSNNCNTIYNKNIYIKTFEKTVEMFEEFYINNDKKLLIYDPEIYEEIYFLAFLYYEDTNDILELELKGYVEKKYLSK